MAALADIPVYLTIGDAERHKVGTIELKATGSQPAVHGEVQVKVEIPPMAVPDLLERVALEMRKHPHAGRM